MKLTFTTTALCALASLTPIAQGAPIVQSVYAGSSTLTLSADTLAFLDVGAMSVSSFGTGSTNIDKNLVGEFTAVQMSAPSTSITIDTSTMAAYAVGADGGGITIQTHALPSVSSGGTLSITDLSLDFGTKVISGTVIGANGVGTLSRQALWTVDNISSSVRGCPGIGMCDSPTGLNYEELLSITASGLHLTTAGAQTFVTSLGLASLGQQALSNVLDFGSLTTTSYTYASSELHIVPEPSTWAMMGLGLLGLCALSHRKTG